MSIMKRIFRIGKANVNAALDKLEDPVKMIDQILRELDEDIAKMTAAVTSQMAVEKRFQRELEETEKIIAKRDEQARVAVERGEDELAREALIDKRRYTEKRDTLKASYEKAKENTERLRKQLDEMKSRVQDMKAKRSALIAQAEAAKATKKITQTMSGVGEENLAESFYKLEEKIQQIHDQALAAQELAESEKSLDRKFEEMLKKTADKDVEDELAQLKASLQNKQS
mgnify:CR=1 FL=1|jgi:phage shock protein A